MKQLGVVLDEVALLRQRLGGKAPDPVTAAALAELGGADACVVHLRGDRQHVQERDVRLLRQTLQARLILRMAPRQEMLKLAYDLKPDEVTLAAERDDVPRVEALVVGHQQESLRKVVQALTEADMRVSVLVEPSIDAVRDAHRLGVQGLVLHARALMGLRYRAEVADERQRLEDAARAARKLGMQVQVSGGLTFEALAELGRWDTVDGLQIGHHLWARALFVGLVQAVRDARGLMG